MLRSVEISPVGAQDISPVQELKNKRYSLVKMMRSVTMQKREEKSEQSLYQALSLSGVGMTSQEDGKAFASWKERENNRNIQMREESVEIHRIWC